MMEKNHLIVQYSLAAKIKFKQDFRLHCGFLQLLFFKKIFGLPLAQDQSRSSLQMRGIFLGACCHLCYHNEMSDYLYCIYVLRAMVLLCQTCIESWKRLIPKIFKSALKHKALRQQCKLEEQNDLEKIALLNSNGFLDVSHESECLFGYT